MGVSKLVVLSVFLMSLYEEAQPYKPSTIYVHSRFKRESEMDCHSREHKKLPIIPMISTGITKNIRPFKVTQPKIMNSLKFKTNNIIPKKKYIPLVQYKPKTLNISIESNPIKSVKVSEQDKFNDTRHVSKSKKLNNSLTDVHENASPSIDHNLKKQNDVDFEKILNFSDNQNNTKFIEEEPELLTLTENPTNETELPTKDVHDLSSNTANNLQLNAINIASKTANETQTIKAKSRINEVIIEPHKKAEKFSINGNKDNIKITKTPLASILDPLTVLNPGLFNVLPECIKNTKPKTNQAETIEKHNKPRKNKYTEHFDDFQTGRKDYIPTPQIFTEKESINKTRNVNVAVLSNPSITAPSEEIIIHDNNYEELYESPVFPQYLSPTVIMSEFSPMQNWDKSNDILNNERYRSNENNEASNQIFRANDNNNNLNECSYKIQQYPNSYVIDCFNENSKTNNLYTYDKPWNDQYHFNKQLRLPNFESGHNYNYPQNKPNYSRIWRTWSNNNIIIRPKSVNTINSDALYKNINGYISNNMKHVQKFNGANNFYGSTNQNILPCSYSNSIWFNRLYGY